jgi:hypothetical protein
MLVLRIIEEAMIKRGITGELSMTLEDNVMIKPLPRSNRRGALQGPTGSTRDRFDLPTAPYEVTPTPSVHEDP